MFELTEEEKAKLDSGEWTMDNVIAARLTASVAAMRGYKPLAPLASVAAAAGAAAAMSGYKPAEAVAADAMRGYKPAEAAGAVAADAMRGYKPAEAAGAVAAAAEIAKSNPESKAEDPTYTVPTYTVPESKAEDPSIWSKLASMLPSAKKAGTAMAGWTRYNGGSSPIAAAYNSWLQGEKTRTAQAATQGTNAVTQELIAKLNNDKASETLKATKGAEAKVKAEERVNTDFRNDMNALYSKYTKAEVDLEDLERKLAVTRSAGPNGSVDSNEETKLKNEIAAVKTQLRTTLKDIRDTADSYKKLPSERYLALIANLKEEANVTAEPEEEANVTAEPEEEANVTAEPAPTQDKPAPTQDKPAPKQKPKKQSAPAPTIRYDAKALNEEHDEIIRASKTFDATDYRNAEKVIAWNKKAAAFNDKLKEQKVPSDKVKRIDPLTVPTKSRNEIKEDREEAEKKRAKTIEELVKADPEYLPNPVSTLAKNNNKKLEIKYGKQYDEEHGLQTKK